MCHSSVTQHSIRNDWRLNFETWNAYNKRLCDFFHISFFFFFISFFAIHFSSFFRAVLIWIVLQRNEMWKLWNLAPTCWEKANKFYFFYFFFVFTYQNRSRLLFRATAHSFEQRPQCTKFCHGRISKILNREHIIIWNLLRRTSRASHLKLFFFSLLVFHFWKICSSWLV